MHVVTFRINVIEKDLTQIVIIIILIVKTVGNQLYSDTESDNIVSNLVHDLLIVLNGSDLFYLLYFTVLVKENVGHLIREVRKMWYLSERYFRFRIRNVRYHMII